MDSTLTTNTLSSEATPLLELHSNDQGQISRLPQTRNFSRAVMRIIFAKFFMDLTFWFIFSSLVLFGRCKEFLDLTPTGALILISTFMGTKGIIIVLGGWLADSKLGKFSIIFCGTLICLIGTILMLVGLLGVSIVFKKAFYITGVLFVAFGHGMITSTTVLFAVDQLQNIATIHSLYSWIYGLRNITIILVCTLFVYMQSTISHVYGHFVPVCFVILALAVFVAGKRAYVTYPPYGSVILESLKIVKEAIKSSQRPSISSAFPNHWLDQAKTCFGGSFSSWEVEDVKKIYRLVPMFCTLMLTFHVGIQMATTMFHQGEHMNIDFALGFRLPLVLSITFPIVLSNIATLLLIPFIHNVVYPLLEKFHVCPSHVQRIAIGMIFSVASMACAGLVEHYRVAECCTDQGRLEKDLEPVSNMTIFFQMPQYVLAGLGTVFTFFAAFEFILIETPKYLQGFVISIFFCILGLGSFAGGIFVLIVNALTADNEWYPDEDQINNGKLVNYFVLLAALKSLVFIFYVKVAISFKAKKESTDLQITENTSTSYRYPTNFTRSVSNNLVFTPV